MYAYFVSGPHRRIHISQSSALGMPLLQMEIPNHITRRSETKIRKKLNAYHVHRLLSVPPVSDLSQLPPPMETRPLWSLHAVAAVLALLKQQKLCPQRSIVELVDHRFNPAAQQLVLALLPLVGYISLSMPVPDSFAWMLQRDYGIAPLSCPGHASICFVPSERKLSLPLWMDAPIVPGLTLSLPGLSLPDQCPSLPLLAALAQQGRIDPKQLQICADPP